MNEDLRLYFDSVVRLAMATDPATLTEQGMAGVYCLLPSPSVGYAEWSEKMGLGKEESKEERKEGPLTEEEAGKLNDTFIKQMKLMELESNGQGNTE